MALQFSGLQVFSGILLLLGCGMLVTSFVSEYWSTHVPRNHLNTAKMNRGVLKQCISDRNIAHCSYRFTSFLRNFRGIDTKERFAEINSPYRHMSMQNFEWLCVMLLFSGVAMSSTVLICGPCLCGRCRMGLSFLLFLAGACSASACYIYWKANKEGRTFTIQGPIYEQAFGSEFVSDKNVLSWSYFMAVISSICLSFASLLLCISSRLDDDLEYNDISSAV